MTRLIIHPEANADALSAADWYQHEAGLGKEFLSAVAAAIRDLCLDPSAQESVQNHVRRRRVHSFPYDVIFEDKLEFIRVIAVAHHHRQPKFWQKRKSKE